MKEGMNTHESKLDKLSLIYIDSSSNKIYEWWSNWLYIEKKKKNEGVVLLIYKKEGNLHKINNPRHFVSENISAGQRQVGRSNSEKASFSFIVFFRSPFSFIAALSSSHFGIIYFIKLK